MSPTVFRENNFRFFFFSREEKRIHIHVISPEGEAKFWIEPNIELAQAVGYNDKELNILVEIIIKHRDEIVENWNKHFNC